MRLMTTKVEKIQTREATGKMLQEWRIAKRIVALLQGKQEY